MAGNTAANNTAKVIRADTGLVIVFPLSDRLEIGVQYDQKNTLSIPYTA